MLILENFWLVWDQSSYANNVPLQTCTLGLIRSDYMVDYVPSEMTDGQLRLRQIEINTIASGLFGLSQNRIQQFHQ